MSQRRTGFNNPAFCTQYESSLFDYEYIPEIDPDSPDLGHNVYRPPRQVAPFWAKQMSNESSSDDSHGSIVVEERNNRIVTTIYEKKPKVRQDKDGGYVHDISFESTDSNNEELDLNQKRFEPVRIYNSANANGRHRYEEVELPVYEKHRYAEIDQQLETEGVHFTMRKPRVPSPVFYHQSSPVKYISNDFGKYETSSPVGGFEMSDFSPPDYNQRQPPVGAMTNPDQDGSRKMNNLKKQSRSNKSQVFHRSPVKQTDEKANLLTPNSVKIIRSTSEKGPKSVRRNISSAFVADPKSPYRPTTEVIGHRNTAIITPILQRKLEDLAKNGTNFQKVSRMFQSTGNVRSDKDGRGHQVHPSHQNNLNVTDFHVGMKRKSSVPNFQQDRTPSKTRPEVKNLESPLNSAFRKLQYQSPTKSPENFANLNKSGASLMETMTPSFTTEDEDYPPASSSCLLLAAVIQLVAGMVTCGISFYLLSKLGRQYYLDMAVLSGFVSMVLGGLGLRRQRWKWLLNGNYVLSYIVLAGFSIANVACLFLIISVRPVSHDPFINVCIGIICAVSVIVIGLSLTGFVKSGCCRSQLENHAASV